MAIEFQSTPSARRATISAKPVHLILTDFNPRPPRGGRPAVVYLDGDSLVISIHALREEGDGLRCAPGLAGHDFNPRPPRGGRRDELRLISGCRFHFNPRPPRGGRPHPCIRLNGSRSISIHALREEGDGHGDKGDVCNLNFNPRPPRGGRPQGPGRDQHPQRISIHALREEGDVKNCLEQHCDGISIHALREEGDRPLRCCAGWTGYFNPRPPRGGRPRLP